MKIDKKELLVYGCIIVATLLGIMAYCLGRPVAIKLAGVDMVAEVEFKTNSSIKGTGADIATEVANELK